MNFYISKFIDGRLRESSYNDIYLSRLSDIFLGGSAWTDHVKRRLLDQNSKRITGNSTVLEINNNKVSIYPLYEDEPEDITITIDRQLLINLINTWQDLVSKNAQEITFIRHDDGSITMSGKFEAEK